MAYIFALAVNFGRDRQAAAAASALAAAEPPILAGNHQVRLHPLVLAEPEGGYLQALVVPAGAGYGVALDRGRLGLTVAEMSQLGHGLYRLLSRFRGYQAARVGWDPEEHVDLDRLRTEAIDDLRNGQLPGLVLARHVLDTLPPAQGFTDFAADYAWIPYQGEHWAPDPPRTATRDPSRFRARRRRRRR